MATNFLVKLLTWSVSPMGLLTFGLVLLIVAALTQRTRRVLWVILLLLIPVWLTGLPAVAFFLKNSLEKEAVALHLQRTGPPYDAILLLGGMANASLAPGQSPESTSWQANFTQAVDRAIYAARLYREGLAPRILVSGGVWPATIARPPEAFWIRGLLMDLGVPDHAIITETASTTTRENMSLSRALLEQSGWTGRLALVSSASHMPRSYANAQAAGLEVDAYPTDWAAYAEKNKPLGWLPSTEAIAASGRALKEWLARLVGY